LRVAGREDSKVLGVLAHQRRKAILQGQDLEKYELAEVEERIRYSEKSENAIGKCHENAPIHTSWIRIGALAWGDPLGTNLAIQASSPLSSSSGIRFWKTWDVKQLQRLRAISR